MVAENARARPLVLVALPSPRTPLLDAMAQTYPRVRLRLDDADVIDPATLAQNQVARSIVQKAKDAGGRLHLIGLVSDGGAHSSLAHLAALIDLAKSARVRVVVHALLDGVDTPPRSAVGYIAALEAMLEGGVGRIGTVSGRALGMDCEGRWDRIEKVYKAIVADGVDRVDSARRGIEEACLFGNIEAFVKPFVVFDYPGVSLVDTALHFNFGAEGARELALSLASTPFTAFARKNGRAPFAGRFASMTPCDAALSALTLFPRAPDPTSLPLDLLVSSAHGYQQFDKGTTASIASATTEALRGGQHDVVLADFGRPDNADRGGDGGALDRALSQIVDAARAMGVGVVILAGRDATNACTALCIDDGQRGLCMREDARFCDLGPTLLALRALPQPADVEGRSLLSADDVRVAAH